MIKIPISWINTILVPTDGSLTYQDNTVSISPSVSGSASGSIGTSPYTDNVVEISFSSAKNIPEFGECKDFSVQGWAGSLIDNLPEDVVPGTMSGYFLPVNQAPVPDADGPYSGYVGDLIQFDGSGSYNPDGTIVAYAWDLDGDGTTDDSTEMNPTWTYSTPGVYQVKLEVTDDFGFTCPDTARVIISATPTPTPPPTSTPPARSSTPLAIRNRSPDWTVIPLCSDSHLEEGIIFSFLFYG
ncbi:MAG: PKD domain-containing protein [Candidatus Syntropharchaeia archaeon]